MEQVEFQTLVITHLTSINGRLESIEGRLENLEEQTRDLKEDMRDLKRDMHVVTQELSQHGRILMDHDQKLNQLLAVRDKVKLQFGWQWGAASFMIAVVAAGLARMVV